MCVHTGREVGGEGSELLMACGVRGADSLDAFVVAKTAFGDGGRQGPGCVFPVGFGGQPRPQGWGRGWWADRRGPEWLLSCRIGSAGGGAGLGQHGPGGDEPGQPGESGHRQEVGRAVDEQAQRREFGGERNDQPGGGQPAGQQCAEGGGYGQAGDQQPERDDTAGAAGGEGQVVQAADQRGRGERGGLGERPGHQAGDGKERGGQRAAGQRDGGAGGADSQGAQPGGGGRGVDRQRDRGRELEERADLDGFLVAVEVGQDARARIERRGECLPGHRSAGDQAGQEQGRRDDGQACQWRATGELAVDGGVVLGWYTSCLLDRRTVRAVLPGCAAVGPRDGRGAGGAGDEAQVDGGQLPAAGVAGQDEGCADGFGDGVALIAAAGVVARGEEGGPAGGGGVHLAGAKSRVGGVAVTV